MKNIWIIDHYSSEPKYGGISRQYDFANELSKRGYKVNIISSSFSHFNHKYITEENLFVSNFAENANYIYLKTAKYTSNNGLSRIFNMFSFKNNVLKYHKKIASLVGKPDIVVGCSIHPLTWLAAYKISKKYKVKFVAEVRDLWPEMWLLNGEKKKYDPMVVFFGKIEKYIYKRADKIIYSMLYGDKYICDKLGFSKEKTFLVGQPLDCERYELYSTQKIDLIPSEIISFMKDSFTCVFTGYYMVYEGVYVMLEAAKKLQKNNIPVKFVFVGSGKEEEGMKKFVLDNNLKNVLVHSRINKEAIPALLRMSDICLAHCSTEGKKDSFKYGVSKNKVNEYLYANSCIIYGRDDKQDPVAKYKCGFVIEPFSSDEFYEKIKYVYNLSNEERLEFAENGKNYIINNNKVETLVDLLLKIYDFE